MLHARRLLAALGLCLGCTDDVSVIDPNDAATTDRSAPRDATVATDVPSMTDVPVGMDVPVGTDVPMGVDRPSPQDAGRDATGTDIPTTPPPGAAPPLAADVLAHVREVLTRGAARGNRHDVFAKIGDSITESGSFLIDCGTGALDLSTFASLQPAIDYFSRVTFADIEGADPVNSYSRHSLCAMGGWVSSQAIEPYMGESTPRLVQELDALHPAWALVEYGTNDVLVGDWVTPDAHPEAAFERNLNTIIDMVEARGTVPVIYTIPPLLSTSAEPRPESTLRGVDAINAVVRSTVSARHLPLIDFYSALVAIPGDHGLDTDGIHPTAFRGSDACIFTPPALSDGYNVRNLVTIQLLARLMSTH